MPRAKFSLANLSRRERQIMEIIYSRGRASAQEVLESLESPPSYSAVRAALSLLEKKGLLTHSRAGAKYLFEPVVSPEKAKVSVLKRVLEAFFDNSASSVVATLVGSRELAVSDKELARLEKLITDARKERSK
ncbi:predicted transcriptional regulator [Terrimicrobium sacchariphilum]|uniref:Predicted transcriptional regulator n=1 Tax=Terrimicrobium sacchariphilum TaxID=690879 RepID=A0A146G5Q4_TERSA|nr:BlaI/MecI/CopY family transcriptional regulator [Terrimicrobium sacchariphilum]GAT32148.1 predicted transcriptional regulator [Terrimicrobium sacchariphilum]